jgi:hypothetical protein
MCRSRRQVNQVTNKEVNLVPSVIACLFNEFIS